MAESGKAKPKLYWYPKYRSCRVVWLLKELGIANEFEFIKYKRNENPALDAEFLSDVNPHGTVPALVYPGEPPLLESGAICMYLAEKYGKLLPDETYKLDYTQFIFYAVATLDEVLVFFFFVWMLKLEYPEARVEYMRKKCDTCMTYLSKKLDGRQFVCGDKFTAADCVLGYNIFLGTILNDGELIKNYPKIKEYYERISARQAFQEAINMK